VTVRVLVDSAADIPPPRARELGIEVVPLTVHFGDDTFRDGLDLDGKEFYRPLTTSHVMPTTSTPPPALFEDAYRKLLAEGATGILAMHIGSDLSATYSFSTTAARTVAAETGIPIEVMDSRQVSAGFGLPAEMVAAEAKDGAALADLKAHAENLLSRVHLVAVLDTLEFLQRGGRIGRGSAFLGTMMNIKPLLEVRDSAVHPLERVRTTGKARERVGQIIARLGELEAVAVVQSDDTTGQQIAIVARQFWNGPIEIFSLGPVVGTHAGPGAGAIVAITRK